MINFAKVGSVYLYMIEKLNENSASIDYFNGAAIPRYKSISLPQNLSITDVLMVESIMKGFESICGYISGNKLKYYDFRKYGCCIDFSKDEVVVYIRNADFKELIQQHALFNFISSPCKKVWFLNDDDYINFTKTTATYNICSCINTIFQDFTFFRIFTENVMDNDSKETIFDLLNLVYANNKCFYEDTYIDWKNNFEEIMMNEFKLQVTKGVC